MSLIAHPVVKILPTNFGRRRYQIEESDNNKCQSEVQIKDMKITINLLPKMAKNALKKEHNFFFKGKYITRFHAKT